MSNGEDYIDPLHEVCDHGAIDCEECWDENSDPDSGDSEDWECAYPGRCLMPDPLHHRTECHTVADIYRENEGLL